MSASRRSLLIASALGVVTSVLVCVVWGGVAQLPVIHDEAAYLLQARIFASGHWTLPAPPLPEFFQQLYVFNTPVVASKYWPAHSLLMVPGVWGGAPGAMPILFWGVSGALVFFVAAGRIGRWPATVVWLLWATGPNALEYRASYFAQATTAACWMVALAGTDAWLRRGSKASAMLIALALGLGTGARPLTMLALLVPIVAVVATRRERDWRSLAAAGAVFVLILTVIPLWSYVTFGRLDITPYAIYTHRYFPFDKPGWHFDSSPPEAPLPVDMAKYSGDLGSYFAAHRLDRLPQILGERIVTIVAQTFPGWRILLVPVALLGLVTLRRFETLDAVIFSSAALLFLLYLNFAHPPQWTSYYLEAQFAMYLTVGFAVAQLRPRTVQLIAATALLLGSIDTNVAREHRHDWQRRADEPAAALDAARRPAVVFVRFGPDWNLAVSLVQNPVSLDAAPMWVVRDLGSDNRRLRDRAPDRVAYLYETSSLRLTPLD